MSSVDSDHPPIAAIDIGTNSVHLLIARTDAQGRITIIDSDKSVLRLGESIDDRGVLAASSINACIVTLKHMQEIAASYSPTFRVIATHAIRAAQNHQEFIDKIQEATDLRVSVIDGEEEARLVSIGMQEGLALEDQQFLGLDIGGGSSELIVCKGHQIDFVRSLELGAVKLNRHFSGRKKTGKEDFRLVEHEIDLMLAPLKDKRKNLHFKHAVFSSGLAKCLAQLQASRESDQDLEDANGYQLSAKAIREICQQLKKLKDPDSIRKFYRLENDRAQIVMAGTIILDKLTEFFSIEKWIVSSFGIREGIILDTMSRLKGTQFKQDFDIRWSNILKLGHKFQINEAYATQVSTLAVKIYDQIGEETPSYIQDKQGVQYSDRSILEAAAWLHECGKFVSFSRYHKHSLHLISHSNLMGFSQLERRLIGLTARYHRKGKAQTTSFECRSLPAKTCKRINFLASILRIAAAANRSRQGLIQDIKLNFKDDSIDFIFTARDHMTPDLDLYKISKEKALFETLMDRKVQLDVEFLPQQQPQPEG